MPVALSPALVPAEAAVIPPASTGAPQAEAEPTPVGGVEITVGHGQAPPKAYTIVEATGLSMDAGVYAEAAEAHLSPPPEVVTPQPARLRRASSAPMVRSAAEVAAPATQPLVSREVTISSFEEFAKQWKHGLRKGQFKICEILYQKTYAAGRTECVTSFSELGRLSGLKMRQCFNIIAQLEALRFIERSRSESTSNKKDQGSVIRFHLYPVQ